MLISRAVSGITCALVFPIVASQFSLERPIGSPRSAPERAITNDEVRHDSSAPLISLSTSEPEDLDLAPIQTPSPSPTPPDMTSPPGAKAVEQTRQGKRPSAEVAANFDGLGVGFKGPQGTAVLRNPSDNSVAVGPDHIFQIVNTRMAVFSKKGKKFEATGEALYGPVQTRTVFKGFGGACEN